MKRMAVRAVELLWLAAGIALIAPASAEESVSDRGPWYFGFGAGKFFPGGGSSGLQNRSGQAALAFDIGYRFNDRVSLETTLAMFEQRVDTPSKVPPPFLGTVDGRASVATLAVGVTAKLSLPGERFVPFVGAGGGLYGSTMRVTGSVLGLPASTEEQDTTFGTHLLAGFDYWFRDRAAIGLEYRRTFFKGDFGRLSDGESQLGGGLLMLTLRMGPRAR